MPPEINELMENHDLDQEEAEHVKEAMDEKDSMKTRPWNGKTISELLHKTALCSGLWIYKLSKSNMVEWK